ncbi:MAG: 16S rRNA (guanine(527)-N(7))-methyltransferase RsmG [Bacteroidales bacterium]|nr:16S rRNA (guanine(527)-N(7))-methyltransferase RsmG [Bacteroidales bacterium]
MSPEVIYKYFPDLSQNQREQIEKLGPLYRDWNSRINVISRKDTDCFYLHHVLHSLSISKFIAEFLPELQAKMTDSQSSVKVMDVGCGGGFPGIPLAILYPQSHFLLVDSIGKKIKVAQAVADAIGLKNVTTLHSRAEEVTLKDHFGKEKADLIVSRAVTSLDNFIPWVKGKYTEGILYLKGGNLEDEIAQAEKKCRIRPSQIFQKEITDWFNDSYFQEKKVLLIK